MLALPLLLALTTPVAAQQSTSGPGTSPAVVAEPTLPVLVTAPAAPYPPAALAAGLEATVLLELDVDATGLVLDARVAEPAQPVDPTLPVGSVADQGFEDAALQAARAFRFTPARDAQGQDVPARIQYRSRFTVAAAPRLSLSTQVQDAQGLPLPGARVVVVGPDGARQEALTDADGVARFADLPVGSWTVAATAEGWLTGSAGAELDAETIRELTFTLQPDVPDRGPPGEAGEEIEIVGQRLQPEVTERVLSVEQIQYLPGTGGDVVKAVQNLPGVNRAPLGVGQILIRGTAPEDSAAYLDGMPLPIVFHFAGLNTVINGDSLEEVAFLPGNYGVRYGRTLAGLIDLRTDPSLPEESSGYVSVDLFQATAFVEQRLSDRTALTISGRRSYIDAVLTPVLTAATGSSFQAPRYYDLNARLLHRTDRGDIFDAFLVGSSDVFRVLGTDESTGEEETTIGLQTRFAKLRLLYRHFDDKGIRHETVFITGPEEQRFQLSPDGDAFERPFDLSFRHELFKTAPGGHRDKSFGLGWRVGLDGIATNYKFVYDVPSFGLREEGDIGILAPAAYVEPTIRLSRWDLVPGLRGDLYTTDAGYTNTALDPRMAVLFHPWTRSRMKIAVGKHSQFPEPREVTPSSDGELSLTHEYSIQTGIGWEQGIGQDWTVEVSRYYNWLQDLVVGNEDAFRFFTGPPPQGPLDSDPYANDGVGRTAGLELLVRYQSERTVALLAGTLSHSVRQKRPDAQELLFEYDQPLVINALASHELPKRWRVGARFRYGSGNPYFPLANRWLDLESGDWQPVFSDEQDRTAAFYQLDLRVDKTWDFRRWDLSWYLDLQNATNRQNPEVIGYSDDYYTEEPVNGLPIIPAFGLKGEG